MKNTITAIIFSLSIVGLLDAEAAERNPRAVAAESGEQQLVVIKSPPEILTRQKLPNFVGISGETAGANGLSMNLVIIPPGAAAEPHFHKDFESILVNPKLPRRSWCAMIPMNRSM